jgi:hypothetical protein
MAEIANSIHFDRPLLKLRTNSPEFLESVLKRFPVTRRQSPTRASVIFSYRAQCSKVAEKATLLLGLCRNSYTFEEPDDSLRRSHRPATLPRVTCSTDFPAPFRTKYITRRILLFILYSFSPSLISYVSTEMSYLKIK